MKFSHLRHSCIPIMWSPLSSNTQPPSQYKYLLLMDSKEKIRLFFATCTDSISPEMVYFEKSAGVCASTCFLAFPIFIIPLSAPEVNDFPLIFHGNRIYIKPSWRLCTQSACRFYKAIPHKERLATLHASACKFPVIFHKNAREYIKYSLRFLFHLTKNLTTYLSHNLCAVLP